MWWSPRPGVRHREVVAGGLEPLPGRRPLGGGTPTMQALQRRHELRAVLKCYTLAPPLAGPAAGRVAGPRRGRGGPAGPRPPPGPGRRGCLAVELPPARRAMGAAPASWPHTACSPTPRCVACKCGGERGCRATSAGFLTRGSTRPTPSPAGAAPGHAGLRGRVLTGSVGLAFSEDADFDELDDLGRRSGATVSAAGSGAPLDHRAPAGGRPRGGALGRSRSGPGSCSSGPCRSWGSWPPLPCWSTSWHHFFSGWQSAGVGTTAPSSPAFGLLGLSGRPLGAMGTPSACCCSVASRSEPGAPRLLRPLVSPRARWWAVICYLGSRCPTARWAGVLGRAGGLRRLPVHRLRLARAAGVEPFDGGAGPRWRAEPTGQVVILGAVIARPRRSPRRWSPWCSSLPWPGARGAPLGRAGRRARAGVAVQAGGVALVLLPWVVGTVLAGQGIGGHLRPAHLGGRRAPSWGRSSASPSAGRPLAHRLAPGAGAALPLVIGAGPGWPGPRGCG